MAKHCPPRCGHVHFSTLKNMARSPAHYKYAADNGTEASAAMNLGSAVHAIILENGRGVAKFDGQRRTGRDWADFEAEHADEIILTAPEADVTFEMAAAIETHERAKALLEGDHEVPVEWTFSGRTCHTRLDVFRERGITELKTTTDAEPNRFQRTAERLGYFAQLAWCLNGVRTIYPRVPIEDAFIVAVETKPPYVVQTFQLTPHALDMGTRQWRLWFERMLVCEASGQWPGYQETDAVLDLPDELDLVMGGEALEVA